MDGGRWNMMVEVYRRTTKSAARQNASRGFRDGAGVHPTIGRRAGLWLSDHPRSQTVGVGGWALL
jgi:hypothetical protein